MNLPKPNDRVSEYVLIENVGKGTFGQVFKARHHVWPDQIVAIKIPTNPDFVRVLRREGSVMHKVSHPNVVRPIGFDPFADPPYLITEFVAGGDLRQQLSHGPLTVEQALDYFCQTLAGLSAAHKAGVIHLDLKPSNLLLDEDGTVKLTDFGLGRALMVNEESLIQSMSMAGEEAAVAGTLEYMAPEQRRGQDVDERADLYAAGILLFEMLTGERPAGGERPSDVRGEVPHWLDEIFTRCYARLEWRYESAEEVLAAVEAGQAGDLPEVDVVDDDDAIEVESFAPGRHDDETLDAIPVDEEGDGSALWRMPWGSLTRLARELGVVFDPEAVRRGELIDKIRAAGYREPPNGQGPAGSRVETPLPAAPSRTCPHCNGGVQPEDQFCIHCGSQLTEVVRRCAKCGGFPQPHDQYCVLCGETL